MAATAEDCQTLSDAIITAFHEAVGITIGASSLLSYVEVLDEQDDYDRETQPFRRMINLSLQHKQTA